MSPCLIEFFDRVMADFLKAVNDDLAENRLQLAAEGRAPELLTGREDTAGARREVEYSISRARAAAKRFLVQGWRLLRRVFVVGTGQALHEPDVEKIKDVLCEAIAGRNLLVYDLVEISHLVVQPGFTDRSVRDVLGRFVEATAGVGDWLSLIQIQRRSEWMPSSLYNCWKRYTHRSSHQKRTCASGFVTASAFCITAFTNARYSVSDLLSFTVPPYFALPPTPLSYESPMLYGKSSFTMSAWAVPMSFLATSGSVASPQINLCRPSANTSPGLIFVSLARSISFSSSNSSFWISRLSSKMLLRSFASKPAVSNSPRSKSAASFAQSQSAPLRFDVRR